MKKDRSRIIMKYVLILGIVILGLFFGFNIWLNGQLKPMDLSNSEPITFEVKSGSGTSAIGELLEENGVIKSAKAFKIKSKMDGNDGKYKAAVYTFNKSMTIEEIIGLLLKGESESVRLTLPEGLDIKRVVEKLSSEGLIDVNEFMQELEFGEFDYGFVSELPNGANRFEGYLYPETYFIPVGADSHYIIDTLLGQFDKMYSEDIKEKAEAMGLSMQQVVTMASILEREAVIPEEMPTIASVFYNRIAVDMPLQTDATIQYALGEQKKRLTYDDLKIDSPYNTYTNKGLPPGPISSVSKGALEAAVNPASTDFIFFVAKGDGSHVFSKDYEQFLKDKEAYINNVFGG
ncbi:MAG: endolytic transglycosylase MltG [Filifactoraceae bacterium]